MDETPERPGEVAGAPAVPRVGGPIVVRETPGFYAWCRCTLSRSMPYCDGTHGDSGLVPVIVLVETEQEMRWCGCGRTATPPRCDDLGCARRTDASGASRP